MGVGKMPQELISLLRSTFYSRKEASNIGLTAVGQATNGQVLVANGSGAAAWDSPAGKRATMWHDECTVTAGNSHVYTINTSQAYNSYAQPSGAADGDAFTNGCHLRNGTYTLYILGVTSDNRGKLDWTLDGASIATGQDWYSAVATYNVVKTIAGIVISSPSWHVLTGTVNGKNVASSSYAIALTKYWFKQAAD